MLFKQANELFQQDKYPESIAAYEQIIQQRIESWEIYYNLGNAYFRSGKVAYAILNYERAKKLAPQEEDVLHNLKIANLSIVDKVAEPPEFFVIKILNDFISLTGLQMNLDQVTKVMLGTYLVFMALVIVRLIIPNKTTRRRILYILLPVGIILIIFVISFQIQLYSASNFNEAIVIAEKVDVMGAPGNDATQVFTLHEGIKVKIENRAEKDNEIWIEIRLADNNSGWVLESTVERI
ncbi:tetratricopeptide repeat protein [candidate division KSB1 bacterium]|nr:tetratricopeptide repeat protein [candidate division KSB1 bacterium]